MLSETENEDCEAEKTTREFLIRDNSGRGFAVTIAAREFTAEERQYCEDEDDEFCQSFGEWLESCDVGDDYENTDTVQTITRVK